MVIKDNIGQRYK